MEWVRIHNLPDHVYFNHSQHTKVGGVQCQTCHGDITNMHEVKQHADLSMGWCVNCHRETKVNSTVMTAISSIAFIRSITTRLRLVREIALQLVISVASIARNVIIKRMRPAAYAR